MTNGQSASSSWCRAPFWYQGHILMFLCLAISFFLLPIGHPLCQDNGSVVCSAITQWSEPHRTHRHVLLSHLRFPQPGGPGPHIYIPQEQGYPVIPPGIGFPFCCVLRLAGLWWRDSNPLLHKFKFKLYCDRGSVGQFVLVSCHFWSG
jgi:hypothetical protein